MTVRTVATAFLGLVLAAPVTAAPARGAGHINAREHRQAVRIRDGVREGAINRRELNRLRGDEAAIRAEERVYRRTGDGLSVAERRDLARDLNRTSRAIVRVTHNGR